MDSYFIWKDVKSLDKDIIINQKPPIPKFERRQEGVIIPGRNGTIYYNEDDAYESTPVTIACTLLNWDKLSEVKKWLDGKSKLILSTQPNIFYEANIVNKIDFSTIADKIYTFPIIFEIQPIAHSIQEKKITMTSKGKIVITEGTYKTYPHIKIFGSGNIILIINNKSIVLQNVEDYIEIDCELEEVYKENKSYNDKVNCDKFPSLDVGENTLSFVGDVESIEIKYREAFL